MSEPETPAVPTPPSDPPPPPPTSTSDNRTLMVVLSYLWILALVPLLVEKEDKEVGWHARNGLVLTGAEIVFWLAIAMLSAASGFIGCLLMPLYFVGWLAILGVHIASIVKGVKGERLLIPGLSQYADRF